MPYTTPRAGCAAERMSEMKLNLWKITAAVLAALLLAVPVRLSADVVKGEYAEGRILVKIVSAPQGALKGRSLSSASSTEIAGMKIEKSWDFAASKTSAENGGRTLSAGGTEGGERIALLSSGTMSTAQMLAAAEKEPSITYAEPDYKIYPASLPNDPAVTEQWAYSNKIKSPAGGAATVNIQSAWGRAEASHNAEVAVAVVDMGVDYEHPDLKDNMWDGSEYGYPKHGWDSALDTNDPMDIDGHGTHVAGIVAASSNNGIGIAGAARGTKIIAVKVFGRSDGFSSSVVDAYSKLLALKASGVKLVATNNYWTAPILSKTAAKAMEALGRAGVVNVVAAANDHADNDTTMGFPFNFPSDYSVVVAASTPWDEIAEFSNYGKRSVHLAAPGAWILSTYSRKAEKEESILKNSFAKPLISDDKLVYYRDFVSTEGLVLSGSENGTQSISTDDGYLEWKISAHKAGTFAITIDKEFDLRAVSADSYALHLSTASVSGRAWNISLCASDGKDGTNRDTHKIPQNVSDGGNSWSGSVRQISAPDEEKEEWEEIITPARQVWYSSEVRAELSVEMAAGEERTIKIKEIAITKGKPYDADAPYRHMDGTSMAAPAVAGCAALLAVTYPGMTPAELRARLIGGAVKIPSMKDKLLSGGRFDVEKAAVSPSPVINTALAVGGVLTLEGWFFGKAGTLALNAGGTEQQLKILSWEDGRITAVLPESPVGWSEITVRRADGDWGRKITELSHAAAQWESLAALPVYMHKARLAADEEKGLIYLAGCFSQEKMTSLFACYDIAEDRWRELASLPKEIYADLDGYGNSISASLGAALTLYKGAPVVIRNYDGVAIIAATYRDGAWKSIKIESFTKKPTWYEKAVFATPAKDGESILLLLSSGTLWSVDPDGGKAEKMAAVPELSDRDLDGAAITASNGVIAIAGGAGDAAAVPLFCDGERSWTGTPCPLPESGKFTWKYAACGIYNGFLLLLEGTWNTPPAIGSGAYYDMDGKRWLPAPTGRTASRNCGASVVVGDHLYRAAITDFFGGVEDAFERLDLRDDAPERRPTGRGGCAGGIAAAALLAGVPLIFVRKKK